MKEEIEKMYVQALIDDLPPNVFADQVLRLFSVVGRSEQLLAFKKWEAEKCKLPWDASPEQIIEQYISQ